MSAPGAGARTHVIRAPNHLGDVVAALPALAEARADIVVVRSLAPLVEMAGVGGRVLPLDRGGAGWWVAVRELRGHGYETGSLLSPAFSAAWLFRWGGVRRVRGTATDGRSWMLTDRIGTEGLRSHHRIDQYRVLSGLEPTGTPSAHGLQPDPDVVAGWRRRLGDNGGSVVGLFPGSKAPARRWSRDGFVELARWAAGRGARVVVLGGPEERALTGSVSEAIAGSIDAGGRTDLVGLVALISACDVLVTNDSGPMHLAATVRTPTVTLWGPSDPGEARPVGAVDVPVTGPELPCKPCYRNECHRRGAGTILAHAYEECMHTIEVSDVIDALERVLDREVSS